MTQSRRDQAVVRDRIGAASRPLVGLVAVGFSLGALTVSLAAWAEDAAPKPARASSLATEAYAHCSACHGAALEGGAFGPALTGLAFRKKWGGKRDDLREYMAATMPISSPGSLSAEQYADLANYIADANAGLGAPSAAPAIHNVAIGNESTAANGVGPRRSAPEVFQDAFYRRAMAEKQAKLAALRNVTREMLQSPPEGAWLNWRRTQDGQGFSPLTGINRSNVKDLKLAWAWSLPTGTNEIAPIVHDGVMFVQSAREVQALDAKSGDLLWRFQREVPVQFRGPVNGTQRNFAIFGDKIFVATADRHLIAIDFRTGKQAWDYQIVAPEAGGILTSSGPFMAGNVLLQGVAMGPGCAGGCFVVGIDPQTGKQLWKFNTVARPGEPGGDSWNGTPLEERSGAAVWIAGSYDPSLDIAYFGTGGTYGISQLLTPGPDGRIGNNDALYTNSTIALRPSTGKLVWAHQHFPREIWDLDEVFERTLVDLPVDGRTRKLAVTIGKVGILDALDRETGKYVFSRNFGLSNLVTAIDPATGARTINPELVLQPGKPVDVCPSADGARNWLATSYNPQSRVLYVPMQDTCMTINWVEHEEGSPAKGKLNIGWSLRPPEKFDGNNGLIEAVDLVTRKTLWTRRDRYIPASSLLATAGGVVFGGNVDRTFRALDDRTGEVLWETRLNAVASATPITFSIEGKQYIAVAAGGGGAHEAETVEVTPEMERSAPSTTLWVFAAPD